VWAGNVLPRLWLALALCAQGKKDEARKELDDPVRQLDRWGKQLPARTNSRFGLHLHDWLEAQVLRREAEERLRPD
jgi:hypothetical protein